MGRGYTTSKVDVIVGLVILICLIGFMIVLNNMFPGSAFGDSDASVQIKYNSEPVRIIKPPTPEEIEKGKMWVMPINSHIVIDGYTITSVPGGWIYDKQGFQPIFVQDKFNNKRE